MPLDNSPALRIVFGDLWGPHGHICDGSEKFAVLVDADPEAPMLIKYGATKPVRQYFDKLNNALLAADPEFLLGFTLLELPVHKEIVAELNACIECTGRIGKFQQFLAELGNRHPELAQRPQYPN